MPPTREFRRRNLAAIERADRRILTAYLAKFGGDTRESASRRGTMPRRILSRIAVAAALVISGLSLDLQAYSARANDCLATPKAASPQGQHWYYRFDRSSHRKCWYLHATLPVSHQAVITRAERHELPTHARVATSQGLAETAPRLPELRAFAEKLHSALFVNATSDVPSRQIVREESDSPSIPPESSTDSRRPDAGARTSNDAEGVAQDSAPAGKGEVAGALGLIFFLFAAGLAVAGFLVRVVIRVVSGRPIDVPETAWIEHGFLHEQPKPRSQLGQDQSGPCLADSRSREQSDQNERIKESSSVLPRRSKSRSQHLAATSVRPLRQSSEGIERALRAIRQAHQQRSA
jgi:hypothetical protein